MSLIKIKINGEEKQFEEAISVQQLVEKMQVKAKMFVVEQNRQIIDKNKYPEIIVQNGDEFEIVGFFGGG